MLWTPDKQYLNDPFENEPQLEAAILEVSDVLFGPNRIYLDVKKLIGSKGKTKNIPDGYLIDLTSKKEPRLFVVENELASHDPLNHVAVQILEFSLYLTLDQLTALCRWKSPRSAGHAIKNSLKFVEEVTRFTFSAADDRSRIESLTLLDAVEYPTASTILHWFHHDPFTFWQSYLSGWRTLLRQAQEICAPTVVTPRLFDKALWSFSAERQPPSEAMRA